MLRTGHKTASLLPRPLGLVEDLNGNENYLADLGDNWFCRLLDDDSALLGPLGTFFGEDTAPLLIVGSILGLLFGAALFGGTHDASGDHLDHLVGELTKSAASTSATTATSAESSVVVLLMRRRLLIDFLFIRFINGCHDY